MFTLQDKIAIVTGAGSGIAAAALDLASDESAFVTGSAMVVDGGYTAGK